MPENAAPDSTATETGTTPPDGAVSDGTTPGSTAAAPATHPHATPAAPLPGEMSLYAAMLGEGGGPLGRLIEGMMTAQVTTVLARLAVADELAGGPLTASQLAARTGADPDALARLLSAAAVYGLIRKEDAGRYALTLAGALLRTDAEGSARGVAIGFLGPPHWHGAGLLEEIVRSPDPVNPARPGGIYEYYGQHPEEAAWFARAMALVTGIMVDQLASTGFRPLACGRIVDVGGSQGTVLAYLLGALPSARGVLLDRAEALAGAPGYLAGAGVGDRVELAAGDFLREVPPGGDLYVLSQILHNWDDESARTIVRNCHRASRPGSGLLVIDWVLPEGPEPSLAHLMDLIMMMILGGRERSRAEHEAMLRPEGYELVRDTPLAAVLPWRILEFQRV
ncbi:MAG: methyltransferase [Streptosporangiaceae bacterium]